MHFDSLAPLGWFEGEGWSIPLLLTKFYLALDPEPHLSQTDPADLTEILSPSWVEILYFHTILLKTPLTRHHRPQQEVNKRIKHHDANTAP